jgi:hypothetical protein
MATKSFLQNYTQVVTAARYCVDNKLLMPALILIYSLIDSLAWASADKGSRNVRANFEDWVAKWVLPQGAIECTPTDLYAARCGLLHTLTADADLTKNGAAQRVSYAFGTAKASTLRRILDELGETELRAVQVESLLQAVTGGMADFLAFADSDAALSSRLRDAAQRHLVTVEVPGRASHG